MTESRRRQRKWRPRRDWGRVLSLVLCFVRLRLRSVMASTLIHASYNATIFLTAFVATGGYRHLDKIGH